MTNAGIDYGLGQTNIDTATGIRYGVISPHTISGDALSEIYDNGENLSYRAAKLDAQDQIKAALTPTLDELGVLPYVSKYSPTAKDTERYNAAVQAAVDVVWDTIEQDWNDQYEENEDQYEYTSDGYRVETSSLGLYVTQAPYYTFARFCSPCCPGAGDLDSTDESGVKTFCLGHDWFEDGKAPYTVYRVEDETIVNPE